MDECPQCGFTPSKCEDCTAVIKRVLYVEPDVTNRWAMNVDKEGNTTWVLQNDEPSGNNDRAEFLCFECGSRLTVYEEAAKQLIMGGRI